MDIMDICSSPQLFAAYHVLLRLLVPRHSPYALSSLTFLLTSYKLRITSLIFAHQFSMYIEYYLKFLRSIALYYSLLLCHILSQSVNPKTLCFSTKLLAFSLVYLIFHLYIFQCAVSTLYSIDMVGSNGIEPSTSRLSGVRSNHLSYEPIY